MDSFKRFKELDKKPLIWLISIPLLGLVYQFLNNTAHGVRSLETPIDEKIPFIEYFIIPYVVWYGYIVISFYLLFIKSRRNFFEAIAGYNLGLIVCYLFYIFFQTTVSRPELTGDSIFIALTKLIYSMDKPYNAFPSIHVYTTYLFMVLLWKLDLKRWQNISMQVTGISIILSTVFVKQHVILDVIASIFLVHLIVFFIRLLSSRLSIKKSMEFTKGKINFRIKIDSAKKKIILYI